MGNILMCKNEKIYDDEIAPVLKKMGDICKKNNMNFFATVEYKPEHFGTTMLFPDPSHVIFKFYNCLRKCLSGKGVNIDKFLFAIMKWARVNGHSSMILYQLGVGVKGEESNVL